MDILTNAEVTRVFSDKYGYIEVKYPHDDYHAYRYFRKPDGKYYRVDIFYNHSEYGIPPPDQTVAQKVIKCTIRITADEIKETFKFCRQELDLIDAARS